MNLQRWEPAARRAGEILLLLLLVCIPFSVAAIEILFPLLLVAWLAGWVFGHSVPTLWRSRAGLTLLIPLGCFLAVCIFSVFYSVDPTLSLRGLIRKTMEYALMLLIAADLVRSQKTQGGSVKAWVISGTGVVLYGLLQEWTMLSELHAVQAVDPITRRPVEFIRMVGPYQNPNDLATFLMVISLVLAPYLTLWRGKTRILLGLLITALMGCLIRTQSMGGLIGFCVGLAVLLADLPKRSVRWGLGGVAVVAVGLFILTEPEPILSLTFSDVASHQRLEMWRTAWRMILARPWLGQGLNTFMANYSTYATSEAMGPTYAHNFLLQTAAEIGWLGLAAFLWFLAALFLAFRQDLRRTAQRSFKAQRTGLMGLTAGLAAFLIQAAFDTNFYALRQATLFWTLAGCAFGMSLQKSEPI